MNFVIDMKLPSLNDYVKANRTNPKYANSYKQKIQSQINMFLLNMPKYERPIKIHFTWIEGNKKRDLDNVAFAKKFILDAMVKYGHLKDDNRRYVTAFTDSFEYGKETKVILKIEEI